MSGVELHERVGRYHWLQVGCLWEFLQPRTDDRRWRIDLVVQPGSPKTNSIPIDADLVRSGKSRSTSGNHTHIAHLVAICLDDVGVFVIDLLAKVPADANVSAGSAVFQMMVQLGVISRS